MNQKKKSLDAGFDLRQLSKQSPGLRCCRSHWDVVCCRFLHGSFHVPTVSSGEPNEASRGIATTSRRVPEVVVKAFAVHFLSGLDP